MFVYWWVILTVLSTTLWNLSTKSTQCWKTTHGWISVITRAVISVISTQKKSILHLDSWRMSPTAGTSGNLLDVLQKPTVYCLRWKRRCGWRVSNQPSQPTILDMPIFVMRFKMRRTTLLSLLVFLISSRNIINFKLSDAPSQPLYHTMIRNILLVVLVVKSTHLVIRIYLLLNFRWIMKQWWWYYSYYYYYYYYCLVMMVMMC